MSRIDRPELRRRLGDLYRKLGTLLDSLNTALPTFAGVAHARNLIQERAVLRR